MTIPIPAFKPLPGGGYEFCANCALMWLGLILAGVYLLYVFRRKENA